VFTCCVRAKLASQTLFVIITFKQHAPKEKEEEEEEEDFRCRRRRLWCFFLSCLFLLLRSDTKIIIRRRTI
jgi:hypothetical protein